MKCETRYSNHEVVPYPTIGTMRIGRYVWWKWVSEEVGMYCSDVEVPVFDIQHVESPDDGGWYSEVVNGVGETVHTTDVCANNVQSGKLALYWIDQQPWTYCGYTIRCFPLPDERKGFPAWKGEVSKEGKVLFTTEIAWGSTNATIWAQNWVEKGKR